MTEKKMVGEHPGLSMATYLATKAVSASLVKTILDQCPRAAWHSSWLNPHQDRQSTAAMDTGTIVHQILLEGHMDGIVVIDPRYHPVEKTGAIPAGWMNKSIKAARDAARDAGKIPVLIGDMAEIEAMVASGRAFIESLKDTEPAIWAAFQPDGGDSELTMIWQDGDTLLRGDDGTLCRMRPDRISKDRRVIIDVKTSAMSVEPDSFGRRQMISMGYYISAAFYRRGIEDMYGISPAYVFLAIETAPPYLCSLVGIDPAGFELGGAKVEAGLNAWRSCARSGNWPGYPNRVCYPELPPWEQARWEEKEAQDIIDNGFGGERAGGIVAADGMIEP